MPSLRLPLLVLFGLAIAASSKATELYVPTDSSIGPQLRVQVFADDGFTRLTALDESITRDSILLGQGAAEILGTLDPAWFLEAIDLRWGVLRFSGTVGATSIPWELEIGQVTALNVATGSSPYLTPDGLRLFPGGSTSSSAISFAGVRGRVTGSLVAQSQRFDFDTGETLLCDACVSGTLSGTPAGGLLPMFEIASTEFSPVFDEDFPSGDLVWTVKVFSFVGDTEMALVPEPSTASLVMIGLVGLVARSHGRSRSAGRGVGLTSDRVIG